MPNITIKNLSKRDLGFRDVGNNQYTVEAYGDLELPDTILDDEVFRKWLRWALSDVIVLS